MCRDKTEHAGQQEMTLPYGVSSDTSSMEQGLVNKMLFSPYLYGKSSQCFGNFIDLFLDYQYVILGVFNNDASLLGHIQEDIPHRQQLVKEECGITGPMIGYLLDAIIKDLNKMFAVGVLMKIAYDEAFNGVQINY